MLILAWIYEENGKYTACYSPSDTIADQPPATHTFPTLELARAWVYFDANLLGVPVQWLHC